MAEPTVPAASVAAQPLTWHISHGVAPNGLRVCQVQLTQGALAQQLTLTVDDMEQLAQQLLEASRRARTGLIVPAGPLVNGHHAGPAAGG